MAANFEYPILRPTFESRQLYTKAFFVVNDNFWHQTGGNFECELDERRLLTFDSAAWTDSNQLLVPIYPLILLRARTLSLNSFGVELLLG